MTGRKMQLVRNDEGKIVCKVRGRLVTWRQAQAMAARWGAVGQVDAGRQGWQRGAKGHNMGLGLVCFAAS